MPNVKNKMQKISTQYFKKLKKNLELKILFTCAVGLIYLVPGAIDHVYLCWWSGLPGT